MPTIAEYEAFLDELWEMGKSLKSEKDKYNLGTNMCNRIRKFSLLHEQASKHNMSEDSINTLNHPRGQI